MRYVLIALYIFLCLNQFFITNAFGQNNSNIFIDQIHENKNITLTSSQSCHDLKIGNYYNIYRNDYFIGTAVITKRSMNEAIKYSCYASILFSVKNKTVAVGDRLLFIQRKDYFRQEERRKVNILKDASKNDRNIYLLTLINDTTQKILQVCVYMSNLWNSGIESDYDMDIFMLAARNEKPFSDYFDYVIEDIDASRSLIFNGLSIGNKDKQEVKIQEAMIEYYSVQSQLYKLSIEPTGTYLSYNAMIRDLESKSESAYSKLSILLNNKGYEDISKYYEIIQIVGTDLSVYMISKRFDELKPKLVRKKEQEMHDAKRRIDKIFRSK